MSYVLHCDYAGCTARQHEEQAKGWNWFGTKYHFCPAHYGQVRCRTCGKRMRGRGETRDQCPGTVRYSGQLLLCHSCYETRRLSRKSQVKGLDKTHPTQVEWLRKHVETWPDKEEILWFFGL